MYLRRAMLALLLVIMVVLPVASAQAAPPVMLYYFHRDIRCTTCVALGDITALVAEVTFKKQVAAGELGFSVVNYQDKGNEHFVGDFDLEQPSAVLAACRGDSVTAWRNLDRIWELSDKPKDLEAYLQGEIRAFLAAHGPDGRP